MVYVWAKKNFLFSMDSGWIGPQLVILSILHLPSSLASKKDEEKI